MTGSTLRWTAAVVALLALSGCARDMADLEAYIAEVKGKTSSVVDPIPQMKPYEPFAYAQEDRRSPFVPENSGGPDLSMPAVAGEGLRPDFARNREPLEEFPIDGLRMVGTLNIQNVYFALVTSPDGVVHRVSTGNYMGQNFGEIVEIREAEIRLSEIVPDGFGGYVKRPAKVALSDT